ncbi:gamma-glutamylcyclotransferase family protein [Desulfopila sp. IMCC35008]|uniref:gamma-glutamylcyclotransferase family protein n=1 Tax=Desulfopila sp. IMCC35008 TaxID=2653858 RepID=UPI0013D63BD9|nr:gamma-glutamylcyclotransferase family protein [Desulfopila sp. IMCC35008]
MDREIMNDASGSQPVGEKAVLSGFSRYRIKNAQYPGIRQEQGGRVDGLLYLNVEHEAVHRLDIFEGDMYSRMEVEVQLQGANEVRKAMTYVVKGEYAHMLSSLQWNFEEFIEKGKSLFTAGYHGFDDLETRLNSTRNQGE